MQAFPTLAVLVLVLGATGVSCDKLRPPQPQLQSTPATGLADGQQGERAAFARAAQLELEELHRVIADFRAKAESANTQTKARLGEEVAKLETQLAQAQQQLLALKSVTLENWQQWKTGFGEVREKLRRGVEGYRKSVG